MESQEFSKSQPTKEPKLATYEYIVTLINAARLNTTSTIKKIEARMATQGSKSAKFWEVCAEAVSYLSGMKNSKSSSRTKGSTEQRGHIRLM